MNHFLDILNKRKTLTSAYIFIGVAIAFLNTYSASYLQKVLDGFGYGTLSAKVILIYGAILISTCILNYIDEYPNNKLSNGIYLDFKLKVMRKISTIDYSNYQTLGTGSLIQQVENGASSGKSIIFDFYFQMIREHIPSVIFSLIFIAAIDKTIMIYILIGYILVFIVTKVVSDGTNTVM
ncbi:ABC transporter transmembrane domain-containing protein [Clostridium manihotivorum]|uniref:ABC transmembrane type-1 domain-containing protein n=1 Tax=Clostridium manihotivorum TaxID=2320868 RepID=A0A410DW42_9CLOT|nr:ABC transporter transmembrane domain-containing protein [Clostridium manihotivorum]QAA33122.1 hypothetical protein C1I91_16580 [Clostridium manihotivorum]